jgi:hypothetical protein
MSLLDEGSSPRRDLSDVLLDAGMVTAARSKRPAWLARKAKAWWTC